MKNGEQGFKRVLSRKDILALSFGAMIGWSWVVLAGNWVLEAGPLGAMLAFGAGGVMVLFVGLTYAELTSAMPKCGGEHVFSLRALGKDWSFVCTWAIILGYVSVVAFEAIAFPTVFEYLVSPSYLKGYMYTVAGYKVYATWVLIGVIASIIITYVNYIGIKPVGFFQSVTTLLIAGVGIALFLGSSFSLDTANFHPLFRGGMGGFFSVLIMTPFLFVGFDVIPQAAEEINIPFKMIGKILLLSIAMAVGWYIMVIFSVSAVMGEAALKAANLVTADAMKASFNGSSLASTVLIVGGIGGILTSWNSFFVGGSRAVYALAESGMLPSFLAKLHPKYKTPSGAILMIGCLSTLAPLFGREMLVWLVDAGGMTIVVAYLLVSISFLVLRENEPEMERPYRIKNSSLVGWVAVALSSGMLCLYMPGLPSALIWPSEWGIIVLWTLLGGALFCWSKVSGSYANGHEFVLNEQVVDE